MVTANPRSWFSWHFTLVKDGVSLAEIDTSSWREKGVLKVQGASCRLYREGMLFGEFVLEAAEGSILARARKPSAWTRRLLVDTDGSQFELKPFSSFRRGFNLLTDGRVVGSLSPLGFWNRRMKVELPEQIPVSIRAFMVWLVILSWRREANSGG